MGLVMTLPEAEEAARECREAGGSLVFTNGCFDLLHVGHARLLVGARREGNALFVAVNDDESAHRLKGRGRPIVGLPDRMELLAALESVDVVFPFPEDTPLEAIRRIHPDVLVKGSDYALAEIVGADLVDAWGGRVVRFPLAGGRSSTRFLDRLREGGRESRDP